MPTTSIPDSIVVCPKQYQTSEWGQQISNSDVWEGPMADLLALQADIKASYTTTQLTPTKGGHGRLVATLTTSDDPSKPPGPPTGDITIEVEWVELRLPVETNVAFNSVTPEQKANIRSVATSGKPWSDVDPIAGDATVHRKLYDILAKGTTEWSTGVPVVRQTTKNASGLAMGYAWYRDNPPVIVPRGGSGGSWQWMKTVDRRVRVGTDIQKVEEWTGSVDWDNTIYP